MKRNLKLFENFKPREDVQPVEERPVQSTPAPAEVVVPVDEEATPPAPSGPVENIAFDPDRAAAYSFKDDKDRLVVDANFGDNSFLRAFHPNEGREMLFLMPNNVEHVGYLGEGDGVGWKITFKKGTTFVEAWNTLRDHESTANQIMKRVNSNKKWEFVGFEPMEDTGVQMENK